jgi:nucleoside-diphosphate-sugar epimerase
MVGRARTTGLLESQFLNMQVLITGAETPLARLVVASLNARFQLRLTGAPGTEPVEGLPVLAADLRVPEQVQPLMEGIDAILHLAPYAPQPTPDAMAEREVLDHAARGTFVLLHAALKAGVPRVVLTSLLDVMAAYPDDYLVDETWKPLPDTTATALAPYLAELTLREFVRAEPLLGVCLRLGELGDGGTTAGDATAAIERALVMDPVGEKYRWWLYHVSSTERFASAAAAKEPLCWSPVGA